MINNTGTVGENKDIQTGKKIGTNISDRINFDNIGDETALDQAIRLILEFKFKYGLDYHVFFISENIIDINEEKNSDFNKIYRFVEDSNLSWNVLQTLIKSNYNLYTAEIQESQERLEPQSKIIRDYVKKYIAKILGHN